MTSNRSVAVIGAGLAGLSCASALQQAGLQVTVFDKSRGAGGRMSTRRGDGWQCDHGAQYFTASHPDFRQEVARWERAGVAARWAPVVHLIDGDGNREMDVRNERFVGVPAMSAPALHLALDLNVCGGAAITGLARAGDGWRLRTALPGYADTGFDMVLLALPAPQTAALLREAAPAQAALAERAEMFGCWAMMLRYDAPLALGFDAAFVQQGPLRWIARDSSKPGRSGPETWLLHASPEWSQAHLEDDPGVVGVTLLEAFRALDGPAPQAWTAHRWRYASTWPGSTAPYLWVPEHGLGMCGDWLAGGTVEAAWLSGRALAASVRGHLVASSNSTAEARQRKAEGGHCR
ncbi:MAG: FAD-dependent oxidoreductase [Pseudomonadota bacterium]